MKELKEIHRAVVQLENYVHEAIPALFDTISANQDQHEVFNNRLNDLEIRLDRQTFRVSSLESKVDSHSEQLAKLNS